MNIKRIPPQTRAAHLAPVLALAFILACLTGAHAQIVVNGVAADQPQTPRQGFTMRKADDKFNNAVDDFQRYRDKKAWEMAFRALANITNVDPKAMAPSKDGMLLPARQRLVELLVSLPPEGRDAYRLFNDSSAKQIYDQALAAEAGTPSDQIALLRKIVDQYFITSVGDQAADRLGDALFETGDYLGAENCWGNIIDRYPDSDLNLLKLQVKRGIAMARGKRWDAINDLVAFLREHNAGTTVNIGGADVVAADYLAGLVAAGKAPSTNPSPAIAAQQQGPLALPAADTAAWQCDFADQDVLDKIAQTANNWGWQGMFGQFANFVPASDTDSKRVYVNWMGACFALDAATGKMLWRTDKFTDISERVEQLIQSSPDVFAYSTLVIPNDRVLFVRVPAKRINYDEPMRLTCHDIATGTQKWSSESGTLSSYAFLGKPVLVEDTLYAPAKSREGAELSLLAIDPANGKLLSALSLATATAGSNYRGQTVVPSPQLMYHQGKIYVLTNHGGVICVNVGARQVEWAFTCEGPNLPNQQEWWMYRYSAQKTKTPGVMIVRDGLLFLKERGADDVYALELAGPKLKWKRPIESPDMLVGTVEGRLVTLGEDAGAIDVNDKMLKWSTRVPLINGMISPMLVSNSLFAFLSRGIYEIDARSGELKRIFRGADRDSMGGAVWRCGDKLVTVSNNSVTAYPLGQLSKAN